MSSVQEIQAAISQLPEADRISLLQWIHQNEEAEGLSDDEANLREEAEKGAQELDAGQGVTLDQARRMTSQWTTR